MAQARAASRRERSPKPAAAPISYREVFHATPAERIAMIKHGVRPQQLKLFFFDLNLTQRVALDALNLSSATVNRKAANDQPLSPPESERVLGFAKLIGQLEAMVEESGEAEGFDAAAWMSRWLREPLPALAGAQPLDLMDTMEGQALVSRTLAQMQSGAYA